MKSLIWAIVFVSVLAQAPVPPLTDKSAKVEEIKPLPDGAQQSLIQQQMRIAGLSLSIAVLQKELDSTTVEWNRTLQKVQLPGYEIDLQRGVYVKKTDTPKDK